MNKKALAIIAFSLVAAIIVIGLAWHAKKTSNITSFQTCAAKYPIQESYPEVCVAPNGQRFVNPNQFPNLQPGHGGPCDDQIYYESHINDCKLQ